MRWGGPELGCQEKPSWVSAGLGGPGLGVMAPLALAGRGAGRSTPPARPLQGPPELAPSLPPGTPGRSGLPGWGSLGSGCHLQGQWLDGDPGPGPSWGWREEPGRSSPAPSWRFCGVISASSSQAGTQRGVLGKFAERGCQPDGGARTGGRDADGRRAEAFPGWGRGKGTRVEGMAGAGGWRWERLVCVERWRGGGRASGPKAPRPGQEARVERRWWAQLALEVCVS